MPRDDQPWESTTRAGRWLRCEPMANGRTFLLRITDEGIGAALTAEITLSEAMSLRAFIGNVARERTSQARFRSGT